MKQKLITLSSLLLLALLVVTPAMAQDAAVAPPGNGNGTLFADPVLLTAGDKPLGGSRIYPSPMMFDLDGDQRLEMYIGDLTGNMWISQKLPGSALTSWGALKPLNAAAGKQLKFHNW